MESIAYIASVIYYEIMLCTHRVDYYNEAIPLEYNHTCLAIELPLYLGSVRYSDRSIFRQVDIPTGLYSDRSIFRQVDIPTGRYSDRSLFRQVYIPTGLYSDRSIFRQVVIPTGLYSDM